jgi:hypothetical protein
VVLFADAAQAQIPAERLAELQVARSLQELTGFTQTRTSTDARNRFLRFRVDSIIAFANDIFAVAKQLNNASVMGDLNSTIVEARLIGTLP